MKITDHGDYFLLESETKEERCKLADVFNVNRTTLWVSSKGNIDGLKLWRVEEDVE